MRLDFNRLPDPEILEDMPDLQKLVQEHQETLQEWREGKTKHTELQAKLEEARRQDDAEGVAAYRAGKKHPGNKNQARVTKELEAHNEFMRVREQAMTAIERDLAATAQKARETIPKLEKDIEADNQELFSLLEKARVLQQRRALRRGLVEWLVKLPTSFRAIPYTQDGLTEDAARNILLASTQPPVEDPDEGTVRLVS